MLQILLIKSSVPSWRILFLIEGLPTVLMSIVAFFMLPDSIRQAKFLTARDKEVGAFCVNEGQVADTDEGQHTGLRLKEVAAGLSDWRSFVTGIIYFGCNVRLGLLAVFFSHEVLSISIHACLSLLMRKLCPRFPSRVYRSSCPAS